MNKNEVAEARIVVALDEIEKAQNALNAACRAISNIHGLAPIHRKLSTISIRSNSLWYMLDEKTAKLRIVSDGWSPSIDREPDEKYDAEYIRRAAGRKASGNALP